MAVTSQTTIRPHVLRFPALALAARFAALSDRMLAWAGVAPSAPSIDRARAIVGWFAAHALHPSTYLHPSGTTANLSVMPPGETWATFNGAFDNPDTLTRDQAYWYGLFPDGISMLQQLVGTVGEDGAVADDGMLTEYAPRRWRIRSFAGFRAPQCTLQCKMAQVVLAAQGILAIDISTTGHDPMMVHENETGRWLYIDPTFGEMQRRGGVYQTPLDLLTASLAGAKRLIVGEKLPGAGYIGPSYFPDSADGMRFMTIHTTPRWSGGLSDRTPYHFGTLPGLSPATERSGTAAQLMPEIGCGVARVNGAEVRLANNWPAAVRYERSINGVTWVTVPAVDYPPSGPVQYRAVDARGRSGKPAILQS